MEENKIPQTGNGNLNDDDFIIGKGFVVESEENIEEAKEERAKKRKKKKRKSIVKSVIWVVVIVVISFSLAFGIIYVGADFMGIGFGRTSEKCEINIPKGSTATAIAEELEKCGAVKVPMGFRLYAKLKGYDSQFKYGYYNFEGESGYEAICQMLINEGAKAESIKVTIPEGTGINDYTKNVNGENVTVPGIGTLLEKAGVCTKSDFLIALEQIKLDSRLLKNADATKTYHTLEGYLFPETYEFFAFDSSECALLAAEKMISEAEKRITDDMYKKANEMGYSMNEILTMASIIQMECGENFNEMPTVAGIFYNRLDSEDFSTLGSSPTCYYGNSFKKDDGRYNTYTAKGLPPGPLCSPGIEAIKAALNPKESDYYYFVTDSKGKFYYHKTSAEQSQTINKLQQGDNWVYEYFD